MAGDSSLATAVCVTRHSGGAGEVHCHIAVLTMATDTFAALRQHMVADIVAQTIYVSARFGKAALNGKVMDAVGKVPRHRFVPVELQRYAYANTPLPIGFGKTISQPLIVAMMTDMLDLKGSDVVLEIGTGLGYQAAILAELAYKVYTVELVPELAGDAKRRLMQAGYRNIEFKLGNGHYGWPEHAPFDKIMVTAAPELVPPALIEQLKPNGRMAIPAGLSDAQQLDLVVKEPDGKLTIKEMLPVRFSVLDGGDDDSTSAGARFI